MPGRSEVLTARVAVPQYGLCDKALYYCNRGIQQWCTIFDKFCDPEL